MPNYVLVHTGGVCTREARRSAVTIDSWARWVASLGARIIDPGTLFGISVTVAHGKSGTNVATGGPSHLNGYSILHVDSIGDAANVVKNCPIVEHGGLMEIYEAVGLGFKR